MADHTTITHATNELYKSLNDGADPALMSSDDRTKYTAAVIVLEPILAVEPTIVVCGPDGESSYDMLVSDYAEIMGRNQGYAQAKAEMAAAE